MASTSIDAQQGDRSAAFVSLHAAVSASLLRGPSALFSRHQEMKAFGCQAERT